MEHRRLTAVWLSAALVCLSVYSPDVPALARAVDGAVDGAASWNVSNSAYVSRRVSFFLSDAEEERDTMDPDTLQQVMDRFLRKSFGIKDAEGIFGSVASDHNPKNLILKPRSQSVDRAQLGMTDQDGELLLSFIYIKLIQPFRRSEERRVGKECRSRWSPDH